MQLGKASAYGAFATLYIAKHEAGGPVQGRDVARSCRIPEEYLLKILQQLVRAQVLRSERGRSGGFLLRKPPSRTTLLEIVEAIQGPVSGELTTRREIKGTEPAKDVVEGVCNDIARYAKSLLRRTTIRQLLNGSD